MANPSAVGSGRSAKRLRDDPFLVLRRIESYRAAVESRRWRECLENEIRSRYVRLSDAMASMRIDSDEALDAMLSMLTVDDRDAYAHAYRVAALSLSIARSLSLGEEDLGIIERGALLHDVGKLAMPRALLRKPAPLTAEERALIRMHPALGSELLRAVPYLLEASYVVRDAHERLDGQGYPRGVRASETWVGARIVTVADAYDTMTRPRVFRDVITAGEALLELERCSGTQFDGRIVAALRKVLAVH